MVKSIMQAEDQHGVGCRPYQEWVVERVLKNEGNNSKGLVKGSERCIMSLNLGEMGSTMWEEEWSWKCVELMGWGSQGRGGWSVLEQKKYTNKIVKIGCCHQGVECLKWRHALVVQFPGHDHGLDEDSGKYC